MRNSKGQFIKGENGRKGKLQTDSERSMRSEKKKEYYRNHPNTSGFQKGHGRLGNSFGSTGKHWKKTPQQIENSRKANLGEKNPAWRGGIADNPYPPEFNSELKLKIRTRDSFICCLCGRTEREELEDFNRVLSVNHIDFNKHNNQEENLNTLCCRCNTKINREREYWIQYFQSNP